MRPSHVTKLRFAILVIVLGMLATAGNASAEVTASFIQAPGPVVGLGVDLDFTVRAVVTTPAAGDSIVVTSQDADRGFVDSRVLTPLNPACRLSSLDLTVDTTMVCDVPNAAGTYDFAFRARTPTRYRARHELRVRGSVVAEVSSIHQVTGGGPSNLSITSPAVNRSIIGTSTQIKVTNSGSGPAEQVELRFQQTASTAATITSITPGVCETIRAVTYCKIGQIPVGGSVPLTVTATASGGFVQIGLEAKGDGAVDSDPVEEFTFTPATACGNCGNPRPTLAAVPVVLKAIANRTIAKANLLGVPASAQCGRASKVAVRLAIPRARAKALKIPGTTAMVTIGSASVSRTAAGKVALTVRLTKAAKAGLKRSTTAVTVTATFTVSGSGALTRSYVRTFKLTK